MVAFAAGFGIAIGVVARGPTGFRGAALTIGGALTGGITCDTEPRAKSGGVHVELDELALDFGVGQAMS